ncbi:MAG: hypothetical protein H0T42_31225 [Deltaproteobacteria bacterium]|nr:hypothetical protein [Deltaproteobacteria bacterium]
MNTLKTLSITTALLFGMTTAAVAQDAKAPAAGKAPAPATAAVAPKMEAPKPPVEVADMAKAMAGTWRCTGKVSPGGDASKTMEVKATIKSKLDLDKWWISMSGTTAGKPAYKWNELTTYDASVKKWFRIGADNMGGSDNLTSTGATAGKIVWDGESRSAQAGKVAKVRFTDELTTAKEFKTLHEISMDGGKTWATTLDGVCKK